MTIFRGVLTGFLLITAALLAGGWTTPQSAAAQAKSPAWVNNPSEQYSENKYLMAVGSAPTMQGAKNQAKSNLAKIFVAKVKVDETYIQEFKERQNSQGEISSQSRSQVITESSVESSQRMKNVQIMDTYEGVDGTYYALAGMDRMKTSQLLTEEIQKNNEKIASLRKKAKETDSRLNRLIYMKQALLTAKMNEMLLNQQSILTGQTTQLEEVNVAAIMQEYRKAKEACTVKIAAGKAPPEVVSSITRELQQEGFTIVKEGENPVVEMHLNLDIKPVDLGRKNAEFMQWSLQIKAQNKENGKWFSTYMEEGREGSMNKQYARQRAIQAIRETITSEFSRFVDKELLSVQ